MTFTINESEVQHILDRYDYLAARCDGSPGEDSDIAAGILDRKDLLALLREHLSSRYDAVFNEMGLWAVIANRAASLQSPSFPGRGVRAALEASLRDLVALITLTHPAKATHRHLPMQPTIAFVKQGGAWTYGRVTGRMNSQLRIAYTITNGEQRERWFARKRYDLDSLQGDLDTVPRFKRVRCPGVQLETPVEYLSDAAKALATCDACGGKHALIDGPSRIDPDYPGFKFRGDLVRTYAGTRDRSYVVEAD